MQELAPASRVFCGALGLGAGRGSRTPKTRRSADFESAASASSAIPALAWLIGFYSLVDLFSIVINWLCALN
jgi:hypothetical protein